MRSSYLQIGHVYETQMGSKNNQEHDTYIFCCCVTTPVSCNDDYSKIKSVKLLRGQQTMHVYQMTALNKNGNNLPQTSVLRNF
jgi:hypothetical protein